VDICYDYDQSWLTVYQQTNGYSVPNYRRLIKQRKDASSNYWFRRYYIISDIPVVIPQHEVGSVWCPVGKYYAKRVAYGVGSFPAVSDSATDFDNTLPSKTYAKFYKTVQSNYLPLVAVGELHENIVMILTMASRVVNLLVSAQHALSSAVRKILGGSRYSSWRADYVRKGHGALLPGSKPRFRLSSRENSVFNERLSDLYLEYALGWKPLVNDLDNLCKEVSSSTVNGTCNKSFSVRKTSKSYTVNTSQYNFGFSGCAGGTKAWDTTDKSWTHTLRAVVSTHYPSMRFPFLHGINDILPSVWELIPYSFCVDYFLNIGDIISAYTSQSSLGFTYLNEGRATSITRHLTLIPQIGSPGAFTSRSVYYSRTQLAAVPLPSLTFNIPDRLMPGSILLALVGARSSLF